MHVYVYITQVNPLNTTKEAALGTVKWLILLFLVALRRLLIFVLELYRSLHLQELTATVGSQPALETHFVFNGNVPTLGNCGCIVTVTEYCYQYWVYVKNVNPC